MENIVDFIPNPTLKGDQYIAGIWFPTQWFDSIQRRRLLIKHWFLGCTIYQFEHGDLLRFPTLRSCDCDNLEGWPLILENGILCSTQLPKKLFAKVADYHLILIIGNQMAMYHYDEAVIIDPAQWVDLAEYQLCTTETYAVNVVYDDVPDFMEQSKPLEQIFAGKMPLSSPLMQQYIEQLQKNAKQKQSNQQTNTPPHFQAAKKFRLIWIAYAFFVFLIFSHLFNLDLSSLYYGSFIDFNGSGFTYLIMCVIGLVTIKVIRKIIKFTNMVKQGEFDNVIEAKTFSYKIKNNDLPPNNNHSINSTIPARQRPKIINPSNWRKYFTVFALITKLSQLIAFRQGKYLETMLKKFEQGDLQDALRYAIPINDNACSTGQSFGVPKPRSKLSLSESIYGEASSIYLPPELIEHLNVLYRQSFDKLAKQNKIEDAVFVLVELLNNLNEALEFLVQHKRYAQAMELAITRDAEPELIVKLCCLANDWNQAIMIARRDNVFANTILLLEQEQPAIANKLRVEWAKTLADKAEWLAAIDAIWPLPEYRYLAEQWFSNTEKLNAKTIVKRFILMPDSIAELKTSLLSIKNNPDEHQLRFDIGKQILLYQQYIDKLRVLLHMFINIIIADAITYPNQLTRADIAKLIELTGDKALKFDIPISSLIMVKQHSLMDSIDLVKYHCPEMGYRAIHDMVALANGKYLVALGEAGILLVSKNGKQLAHFMIAAESFVISDNRLQVLALIKRDSYYRIHKVDLTTEKSVDLGLIKFQFCQRQFDGINWTIVNNNCIEVINIGSTLSVVWRVDLSPNKIEQGVRDELREIYVTRVIRNQKNKLEVFTFRLPQHRLSRRYDIKFIEDIYGTPYVGEYYGFFLDAELDIVFHLKYDKYKSRLMYKRDYQYQYIGIPLTISPEQLKHLIVLSSGLLTILLVKRDDGSGWDIHFYHYSTGTIKATIDWSGSCSLSGRCVGGQCYFYDDKGRLLHVNIKESEVTSFSI